MIADGVPAVPRRWTNKENGPNSADAWAAAWLAIGEAGAADRRDVIAVMRKASPISFRTARDLLMQAVKEGTLEVVSRDRYNRPTLRRPL